jgi:beta-galactosidase beta subunit
MIYCWQEILLLENMIIIFFFKNTHKLLDMGDATTCKGVFKNIIAVAFNSEIYQNNIFKKLLLTPIY